MLPSRFELTGNKRTGGGPTTSGHADSEDKGVGNDDNIDDLLNATVNVGPYMLGAVPRVLAVERAGGWCCG